VENIGFGGVQRKRLEWTAETVEGPSEACEARSADGWGLEHGRLQVGGRGGSCPRALALPPPQLPPHLWLNEFVVPHDEMN